MSKQKTTHDCCSSVNSEMQTEQKLVQMDVQPIGDSCCSPVVNDVQSPQGSPVTTKAGLCPTCNTKGKKVDEATVKSMLSISLREVRNIDYFFCREADCDTVYFSVDGSQTFLTGDIRERVFQKESNADDVFVCYCFRHTPDSIRAEMIETGASTVVGEINAGIKAGQCACDWRNPQGSCCLGNVTQVVKRIKSEIIPVEA